MRALAAARSRRSLRRLPRAGARAQCRLSAGARGDPRLLRRTRKRADRRGRASPNISSTRSRTDAAPRRRADHGSTARTCCRMAGEYTAEVLMRGLCAFLAKHRRRRLGTARRQVRRRKMPRICRRRPRMRCAAAAAPAELLHRLPRAAGVCGAEAGASAKSATRHISADIGCHCVRDLRAVQLGQFDSRLRHVAGLERRRASAEPQQAARSPSWATAASGITA